MRQDELMHYGVPGMRWGIRRKREKDSVSTSTKKKVAIGVGVAAGTAAVATGLYYAKKYRDMNVDTIIKQNTELQHLAKSAIENFDKPLYATHLKGDKKRYLKKDSIGFDNHWKVNQTLVSNKDIKVAGKKASIEVFKEFAKNNKAYEEKFGKVNLDDKKAVKKAYDSFIKEAPPSIGMYERQLASDFFKKMSDKGYDAIRDTYDQKLMKVRSPVIIFNNLQQLMTKRVSDI